MVLPRRAHPKSANWLVAQLLEQIRKVEILWNLTCHPLDDKVYLLAKTENIFTYKLKLRGGKGFLMPAQSVILLEFNEICPQLLDKFMNGGLLPNFKRFYEHSDIYITQADITETSQLEPWIQWYSIHTGLRYRDHKVFSLTDGPRAGHTDIWEVLRSHGKKVGNCASMNSKGFRAEGSFCLPDPWCTSESVSPPELAVFHQMIARQVQGYTNKDATSGRAREVLGFLRFLVSHGLRAKTALQIARQLFQDQVLDRSTSWKRAVLLDKLQFDVFRFYYRKLHLDFATFFINSTAHYQHAYWRHMFPEEFTTKPSPEEIEKYKDCILFGYQEMDKVLGDFFKLRNKQTTLILASALSQKAFLRRDLEGGQHFYRLRDVNSFLQSLHISCKDILPVMTNQYVAVFDQQSEADRAVAILKAFKYNGEEVFGFGRAEPKSIYFGSQLFRVVPQDATIEVDGTVEKIPFYDLLYKIEEMKSGCHHEDGVLWICRGRHEIHAEKVSVLDIFPTVLGLCGVEPLVELCNQCQGKELMSAAVA